MIRLANRLGATVHLPSTISFRQVPLAMSVPTAPNARGDGSVVVGQSRLEPRQFALSGSVYFPSRQQIRDFADNLLQFLQHPPIEVFRWPHPDERRLFAYPLGAPQDWMDAGAELGIDIPMLAPDPYWYGAEVVEAEADAEEWSIDVGGNAPVLPIVTIAIAEPGSSLTLTGPGGVIELDGDYLLGDVVTVDAARFEATLTRSGETELINDQLSDEFVAHGFALVPGTNELDYDGPAATRTLTYRPCWY